MSKRRNRPYIYGNALRKDLRYFGILDDWIDGPIYGFGFWFWHIYWRAGFYEWK